MPKLKAQNTKKMLLAAAAVMVMLAHTHAQAMSFDRLLRCQEQYKSVLGKDSTPDLIVITMEKYTACSYIYGPSSGPIDPPPRVAGDDDRVPPGPSVPDRVVPISELGCTKITNQREVLLALYRQLSASREQLDKSLRLTLDAHTAAEAALRTIQDQAAAAAQKCDGLAEIDEANATVTAYNKCKMKKGLAYLDCVDEIVGGTPYTQATQQACSVATQASADQRRAEGVEEELRRQAAETFGLRASAERSAASVRRQFERYDREKKARCN